MFIRFNYDPLKYFVLNSFNTQIKCFHFKVQVPFTLHLLTMFLYVIEYLFDIVA